MKKLYLLLFCLSFLSTIPSSAQQQSFTSKRGYYIKGDNLYSNIYIAEGSRYDRSRTLSIPEQTGHAAAIFTPDEVSEYGITNGKKYISASIPTLEAGRRVFLEEMLRTESGDGIYYYCTEDKGDAIYVLKSGEYELVGDDNKYELLNYVWEQNGCATRFAPEYAPKRLEYKRINTLANSIEKCNLNFVKRFRWGAEVDLGVTNYTTKFTEEGKHKFDPVFIVSGGLFAMVNLHNRVDLRLGAKISRFETKKEVFYEKTYSHEKTTLTIPLTIRYTARNMEHKAAPYFEMGPIFDVRLDHKTTVFDPAKDKTYNNNGQGEDCLFGITVGAGVEYKLSKDVALLLGLKWNTAADNFGSSSTERNSSWMFSAGVCF